MRYHYSEGVKQTKFNRKILWVLPVLGVFGGGYLLVNTLAPAAGLFGAPADATAKRLVAEQPQLDENRLYIPKVNIDVAVVDINGNETAALEKGAIHRAPDNGSPTDGGNFVLAAHRFQLGLTPGQTRMKSPFYHIDKLQTGDQIYVDYKGTRYAYEITGKKDVPKDATEIEQRTDEPRLTLYSCELSGPEAGREVVVAKQVGTIAWVDGAPKLKTF